MVFIKKLIKITLFTAFLSANNFDADGAKFKNLTAPARKTVVNGNSDATVIADFNNNISIVDSTSAGVLFSIVNENDISEGVISSNIKDSKILASTHRTARATAQSLKLVASNELGSDEIVIRFGIGATRGFDSQWDIYKLGSNNCVPTLSSETEGAEYAINSLPVIEEGSTVNVNLVMPSDGAYTISIKELMNFEEFSAINLYDKLTNTSQNLLINGTYTFTGTKDENKQRFVLGFQHALITSTSERDANSKVNISCNSDNLITINAHHTLTGLANVIVTNMLGEVIYQAPSVDLAIGIAEIKIDNAKSSIYIVKAIIDGSTYCREVYLGE